MKADNKKKREDTEKTSAAKEKEFRETADQYEENRLGQDPVGKILRIGGPKAEKLVKDFQNSQSTKKKK